MNQLPTARLCAVLTTFNRRAVTLAALAAFEASAKAAGLAPEAVLVDDASSDGTAEAVQRCFPWVDLRGGDGSLFWCRGMHLAVETAERSRPDFILWLNDDTLLRPDALTRLLLAERALLTRLGQPVIVVGSTEDPRTGERSYGGQVRASRWWPMRFKPPADATEPSHCDTMTGNIVLVSADALSRVGNLDPAFEHAMGDIDYALRANQRGVQVWADAGVHGSCADNPTEGGYRDPQLPWRRRWQLMLGRKGLPWRSWLLLTRRHAGLLWPLHFAAPYLRLLASALRSSTAH